MITNGGTVSERRDVAVILARGSSSRMGYPKGLARMKTGGPTLVRSIIGLYQAWMQMVVVTLETEQPHYQQAVIGASGVTVLGCEAGGETALSVWLGWQEARRAQRVSHIWAHPVDLPLVKPATLQLLAGCSWRHPKALVRPVFDGTPGHPVVIPATLFTDIKPGSAELAGPFRDLIRERCKRPPAREILALECGDSGTVLDFDTPEDLAQGRKRSS